MVVLRPTRKLVSSLPIAAEVPDCSDSALGDWYVNRLVIHRQPLLLLVSSASLLPIVCRAYQVRELPGRLESLVEARLRRCRIDARAIDAERRAMRPVVIGRTVDRSVLGIMVDFARAVPYYLEAGRWTEDDLLLVEERLAHTPCYASRAANQVVFPDKKAPELLHAKWLTHTPRGTGQSIW